MPPPTTSSPPSASSSYPRTPSSSSFRIPPRLEAYVASGPLARDQGSLTVVTAVQGASANWLVLRYLYALLAGGGGGGGRGVEELGVVGVVLGMDLNALCKNGRFAFVDGLTGLCAPAIPGRSKGIIVGGGATTTTTKTTDSDDVVKACVDAAAARLAAGSRTVLLVDGLDAYVAMGSGSGAAGAASLIMGLRENVYSTLVTLAADEPLVHMQAAAGTTTRLEREQAALVLGQAHAADQVVSLRRLDTGAAADVSGVLRVVVGPAAAAAASYEDGDGGEELLYHVAGDGSVRVFERGA
ncbi:hypothetical protein MY10362_003216 [Beauveria mimosiformis]